MTRMFDISRFLTPDGELVGPEELQEIMAEQGYSSGDRDQYLKSLLTELGQSDATATKSGRQEQIVQEIRDILKNEQDREAPSAPTDDEADE
ncbi:hypothetical protein ROJ8625_03357 [Roseivivax jejudonensis]|uniref:Uncharacterized protein n=1 Tax=Roseivivax jejudonensis TaxID=1529041 RepID=A0A1X6ZYX8_9RHOB|nr:hypothetical protein [Roseivivax jejudonensis]SLN65694.1 hypothetical protein ROJ8625_03357 [Roseivivax jejudonensis]